MHFERITACIKSRKYACNETQLCILLLSGKYIIKNSYLKKLYIFYTGQGIFPSPRYQAYRFTPILVMISEVHNIILLFLTSEL